MYNVVEPSALFTNKECLADDHRLPLGYPYTAPVVHSEWVLASSPLPSFFPSDADSVSSFLLVCSPCLA